MPSLVRAKSLEEYARAGYLAFSLLAIGVAALLDWKATSIPGLAHVHQNARGVLLGVLKAIRVPETPLGNGPLAVLAAVTALGLSLASKLSDTIGLFFGDLVLTVLDGVVGLGERLVRHRTVSLAMIVLLTFFCGFEVYRSLSDSESKASAVQFYGSWVSLLHTTVIDSTLAPDDQRKYQVAGELWNEKLLRNANLDDEADSGVAINRLIKTVYESLRSEDICSSLKVALESSRRSPGDESSNARIGGDWSHYIISAWPAAS